METYNYHPCYMFYVLRDTYNIHAFVDVGSHFWLIMHAPILFFQSSQNLSTFDN